MFMEIIDITIPVQNGMAVWPGDTPYHFGLNRKMSEGAAVNLGSMEMSVHTGTHADAPFHFLPDGISIAEIDPAVYIGSAQVIDLTGKTSITVRDIELSGKIVAPRLLIKTGAWTDHSRFPNSIPVMDADVPDYLRGQRIILLGLDVPSVDTLDSKDLSNHHALYRCGISILESLDLRNAAAREYELIALPLKLIGADGAPVRAVLIKS